MSDAARPTVSEAVPAEESPTDGGPAWHTTLQARVGPFSRSKELRFVRDMFAVHHGEASIRFVRAELDGKQHASWVMAIEVDPVASSCSVTLSLAYDGSLWMPALGSILHGSIESATRRLPEYLASKS